MNKQVSKKQMILLISFMRMLNSYIDYWEKIPRHNLHDRLEGLVFSILVNIDGMGELGGMLLKDIRTGKTINYCGELHSIWRRFDWDKLYEETTKEKNK